MNWNDVTHRRFNPLTGETVLVSPHRLKRPWQGKVETLPPAMSLQHDPNCYLCPGNKRANDAVNPDYNDVFVFTNDFSALLRTRRRVRATTATAFWSPSRSRGSAR